MKQQGFLIISDITGYSAYLNQSELEHARDSLADLLRLLVDYTKLPLVISKLEGDAVFSYAPQGSILQAQTLIEMIEVTYVAFRKALQLMVINTTCTCNACSNLPNLDLKFFIHFGTYSIQNIGRYTELVGPDVNLVHRLTKNRINETLSVAAYAAYTEAVIEELDWGAIAEALQPYEQAFEDVGTVRLVVQDMHGVWDRKKDAARITVDPEDALLVLEYEFPVSPPVLWDYITKPEYRSILMGSYSQEVQNKRSGRTDVETVYYCAHGDRVSVQTILDWQPFEQYTTNETHPLPGISANYTYRIIATDTGSRLMHYWGRGIGPWLLRLLNDIVVKLVISRQMPKFAQLLKEQILADTGNLPTGQPTVVEQRELLEAVGNSLSSSS